MTDEKFESWAIVELMGHRRIAGKVSEQVIGGASLLRIDVPECPEIPQHEESSPYYGEAMRIIPAKPAIPEFTQFYGAAAIYCLTPTTEEIARKVTLQQRERPVALYDISPARDGGTLRLPVAPDGSEDEEDEDFSG